MRWADSELLLGQPARFNLAPSRVPEDHVDIEDCLKDSADPLSPSEEFIIDNLEDLLGRAVVGAFTLVRHCLCQTSNESKREDANIFPSQNLCWELEREG